MIDPVAVKDFILLKAFGILAYVCSTIHILYGLVFTGIIIDLKNREAGNINCDVAQEIATQVAKECFSRYQQHYNAPLRFYLFVLLSTWFPISVAVVYSLWVRRRVEQVDKTLNETQTDGEADNQVHNRTFYVFRFYFIHLALRVLCGVLFAVLQHVLLFPRGFDSKFDCSLPPTLEVLSKIPKNTSVSQLNNTTSIPCENASDKHIIWVIISIFNSVFAFVIFVEIIRLRRRFPVFQYITGRKCDIEFIKVYLLRKEYMSVETEMPSFSLNLQQCIKDYKKFRLNQQKPGSVPDESYINLVIQTERAPHKFSNDMERHEIYDVYIKVPRNSIHLEEVKDLFYPNKDTKKKRPRKILVVGRPGIGKTILTEKILRDWANELDKFYLDKISLYFKFRWFSMNDMNQITLKTFLRNGTELADEKFEKIYEEIMKHPEKAILIFDGLDEFNSDLDCPNDSQACNNPDFPMSAISFFTKIISGNLLPEATVLVTSRPTANQFYSKFDFDRTVEIIGFTHDRIEEYVTKFCQSHNRDDLKPKIWNHIQSSPDLLSSCYIPLNCWIIVTILFKTLKDPGNEIDALPTTLTELYQAAVTHFDMKHLGNVGGQSYEKATKKLQSLAFKGIGPMKLIFDNKSFDEEMKQSGLLNSLSKPYSQVQTQFCFIHLTIQEFLAAKHVIESFHPKGIKEFIFFHINSGKWHLVLQFIAGLLGKQIKMLKKDRREVKDCVLAFAESFELTSEYGVYYVDESYTSLLIMKCLREVEDEEIVKEACETTAINDIVGLAEGDGPVELSSSDWSAVFLVCKHMKNLKKLHLWGTDLSEECYLALLRLLEQRCIEELWLGRRPSGTKGNIFKSLLESKCSLNHEHSKLVELFLSRHDVTDEILSAMCEFFRNGHGICLKELILVTCKISSHELSIFCQVLDDKLCPHLTYLNFDYNNIADEGLTELCRTLTKQKLLKLTHLTLSHCSLTNECVPAVCELLTNECCNLIDLSLRRNPDIKDEGLHMLCELALTKEHCKLEKLDLSDCSLTDECLPELGKTLQDEHCRLKELSLDGNKFTMEGRKSIHKIAAHEHCKTRVLEIHTGWQ